MTDGSVDASEQQGPEAIADPALHCLHCGYHLRGLARSGRCPECGFSIEHSQGLLDRPERLAEAWSLLRWSYVAIFGLVIVFADALPFVLVAAVGAALRIAAIVRFRRAGLLGVHSAAFRVNLLAFLAAAEVVVLLLYVFFVRDEVLHEFTGLLAWLWLSIVSMTLSPAVDLGRMISQRLDHPLIDLQLRNARKCIIAAFVVALGACSALGALRGIDLRLPWAGLAVHALVAVLAFGHAVAACAHLSKAITDANLATARRCVP